MHQAAEFWIAPKKVEHTAIRFDSLSCPFLAVIVRNLESLAGKMHNYSLLLSRQPEPELRNARREVDGFHLLCLHQNDCSLAFAQSPEMYFKRVYVVHHSVEHSVCNVIPVRPRHRCAPNPDECKKLFMLTN